MRKYLIIQTGTWPTDYQIGNGAYFSCFPFPNVASDADMISNVQQTDSK